MRECVFEREKKVSVCVCVFERERERVREKEREKVKGARPTREKYEREKSFDQFLKSKRGIKKLIKTTKKEK